MTSPSSVAQSIVNCARIQSSTGMKESANRERNLLDSHGGVAYDYETLPKIVAVHSLVVKNDCCVPPPCSEHSISMSQQNSSLHHSLPDKDTNNHYKEKVLSIRSGTPFFNAHSMNPLVRTSNPHYKHLCEQSADTLTGRNPNLSKVFLDYQIIPPDSTCPGDKSCYTRTKANPKQSKKNEIVSVLSPQTAVMSSSFSCQPCAGGDSNMNVESANKLQQPLASPNKNQCSSLLCSSQSVKNSYVKLVSSSRHKSSVYSHTSVPFLTSNCTDNTVPGSVSNTVDIDESHSELSANYSHSQTYHSNSIPSTFDSNGNIVQMLTANRDSAPVGMNSKAKRTSKNAINPLTNKVPQTSVAMHHTPSSIHHLSSMTSCFTSAEDLIAQTSMASTMSTQINVENVNTVKTVSNPVVRLKPPLTTHYNAPYHPSSTSSNPVSKGVLAYDKEFPEMFKEKLEKAKGREENKVCISSGAPTSSTTTATDQDENAPIMEVKSLHGATSEVKQRTTTPTTTATDRSDNTPTIEVQSLNGNTSEFNQSVTTAPLVRTRDRNENTPVKVKKQRLRFCPLMNRKDSKCTESEDTRCHKEIDCKISSKKTISQVDKPDSHMLFEKVSNLTKKGHSLSSALIILAQRGDISKSDGNTLANEGSVLTEDLLRKFVVREKLRKKFQASKPDNANEPCNIVNKNGGIKENESCQRNSLNKSNASNGTPLQESSVQLTAILETPSYTSKHSSECLATPPKELFKDQLSVPSSVVSPWCKGTQNKYLYTNNIELNQINEPYSEDLNALPFSDNSVQNKGVTESVWGGTPFDHLEYYTDPPTDPPCSQKQRSEYTFTKQEHCDNPTVSTITQPEESNAPRGSTKENKQLMNTEETNGNQSDSKRAKNGSTSQESLVSSKRTLETKWQPGFSAKRSRTSEPRTFLMSGCQEQNAIDDKLSHQPFLKSNDDKIKQPHIVENELQLQRVTHDTQEDSGASSTTPIVTAEEHNTFKNSLANREERIKKLMEKQNNLLLKIKNRSEMG